MINIEYDKERGAYLVPEWLIRSLFRYDDEILKVPYNSLSDYGKGIVDTLKEQHTTFSVNIKSSAIKGISDKPDNICI